MEKIKQYQIIEKIGEGGMGVVFKAEHTVIQQMVAIKSISNEWISDDESRERFFREARIQAKISHPNIVTLFNFFEEKGKYYLVMEYFEGETLKEMLKRLNRISPEKSVSIIRQVLSGLGYMHAQGVIHRDIKPANIIINREGQTKITDFGIAVRKEDLDLTKTGMKVGTIWYLPPEYLNGLPLGPTADIFSLGVTLYEMVTGQVPFQADTEYGLIKAIVEENPPLPCTFFPEIPERLQKIILKAMAKAPLDRFQTAQEFSRELKKLHLKVIEGVSGSSIIVNNQGAEPSTVSTQSERIPNRIPFRGLAAGIAVILILMGGYWLIVPQSANQVSQQQRETPVLSSSSTLPQDPPVSSIKNLQSPPGTYPLSKAKIETGLPNKSVNAGSGRSPGLRRENKKTEKKKIIDFPVSKDILPPIIFQTSKAPSVREAEEVTQKQPAEKEKPKANFAGSWGKKELLEGQK